MRERVKDVLSRIVADREAEILWLHTVSMMEYIGARKIAKTVCREHPSLDVLEHWSDEARHAYAFKRLAHELAGGEVEGYLCPEAAFVYFKKLDRGLSAWITELTGREDTFQNYLLVTSLIERRAMMLYPLYRAITPHDNVRDELRQVITEEADHRVAIEEAALAIMTQHGVDNFEACEALEADLFGQFLSAVEQALEARGL